jgi:hypothetical protein
VTTPTSASTRPTRTCAPTSPPVGGTKSLASGPTQAPTAGSGQRAIALGLGVWSLHLLATVTRRLSTTATVLSNATGRVLDSADLSSLEAPYPSG